VTGRAFLFSLEQFGIKLGLDQIRGLLDALGRPDRAFPSILIAGTNGKGSVAAMVERGLRAAGCRTGRYTSPHLVHLEERFAIDGEPLRVDRVDQVAVQIQAASRSLPAPPSFFEATTALALEAFRQQAIEVAVLEVGLGGRLDATNAVDPIAVAITSVDFDHEAWLGSTIEAIAREKAGIIKPGVVTVLGPNPPEVDEVVAAACTAAGAPLVRAADATVEDAGLTDGHARVTVQTPTREYRGITLSLAGRHQVPNALVAMRLLEELSARTPFHVSPTAVRTAVEDVRWPARLERIRGRGLDLLIDGAHNPAGARALAAYLSEVYARPLPMVVGIMADKHAEAMVAALAPAASHLAFTAANTPRAARPADLAALAARFAPDRPVVSFDQPADAIRYAAGFGSPVVVAGSLYLAGEVRAEFSPTRSPSVSS
jgi:dihydrofolate synthase/folylpolyglutamate synthase